MSDGVFLAQVFEQRGKRRQPVSDGHAAQRPPHELVAPGDNVRARDTPEFTRLGDADEGHEVLERVFVGAAGGFIAKVSEPLGLRRHVDQAPVVGGRQKSAVTGNWGWLDDPKNKVR